LNIDEVSGSKGAKATMTFYAVGEHTDYMTSHCKNKQRHHLGFPEMLSLAKIFFKKNTLNFNCANPTLQQSKQPQPQTHSLNHSGIMPMNDLATQSASSKEETLFLFTLLSFFQKKMCCQ